MVLGLLLVGLCLSLPQQPIDGTPNTEFLNLPETFQVNPRFLAPKPEASVLLPQEPTLVTVAVGSGNETVQYWYSADDTVLDLFKFIAERTHTPMSDITELLRIDFASVGHTTTKIPFSLTTKLKDVPIIPGDEIEAAFSSSVDISAIRVIPNPTSNHQGELPGFFDVKVKIAGMPMFAVPIPRLAKGALVKTIVEDRCAFSMFGVDLRRNVRDGVALADNDQLTALDSFFWGVLVDKSLLISQPDDQTAVNQCPIGQVRLLTNLGRSHMFAYDCNTTASDVIAFMENIGQLPDPRDTPGYGVIVSTKGFFHSAGIDTVPNLDKLTNHGIQNNTVVFLTVACPSTLVYFQYFDQSFSQILNCSTSIDYLVPLFNRLTNRHGQIPTFTFINKALQTQTLSDSSPILRQLESAKILIVTIDFPPCESPVAAQQTTVGSTDMWDSQVEREQVPAGATSLGEPQLLIHSKWRSGEHSKFKQSHP